MRRHRRRSARAAAGPRPRPRAGLQEIEEGLLVAPARQLAGCERGLVHAQHAGHRRLTIEPLRPQQPPMQESARRRVTARERLLVGDWRGHYVSSSGERATRELGGGDLLDPIRRRRDGQAGVREPLGPVGVAGRLRHRDRSRRSHRLPPSASRSAWPTPRTWAGRPARAQVPDARRPAARPRERADGVCAERERRSCSPSPRVFFVSVVGGAVALGLDRPRHAAERRRQGRAEHREDGRAGAVHSDTSGSERLPSVRTGNAR